MFQGQLEFSDPLPARSRQPNPRRDAIKAAGGAEYEALLAKERAKRAAYRARHPEEIRKAQRRRDKLRAKKGGRWALRRLLAAARKRGRQKGLPATIRMADLTWPTHCPVLGIELDYSTPVGQRVAYNPAKPSLDRFDPAKGYVPGNVFVISYRANTLKNNATYEEILKVAKYLSKRPSP